MKTKQDIVQNWLPRYTKRALEDFTDYILLTNFHNYVEKFAAWYDVPVLGKDGTMTNASANGITIINFGMGSPNAALIMDVLSAIQPKAVLFLGKCGGLKDKNQTGDYILPSAAIRGEGTSTTIFRLKFRLYLHLTYNVRFLRIYAILGRTTGQERFIPQTVVSGNTMMISKIISAAFVCWQ